jgi:hypothetical protein
MSDALDLARQFTDWCSTNRVNATTVAKYLFGYDKFADRVASGDVSLNQAAKLRRFMEAHPKVPRGRMHATVEVFLADDAPPADVKLEDHIRPINRRSMCDFTSSAGGAL